ncbi:MAG: hypothetical protein K6G64_03680 [Eubacterium sp.]|nr:hypothetical protein [Eubacterium sp.]
MKKTLKRLVFSILLFTLCITYSNAVNVSGDQKNPLLEGITIEGPDYIYEFEKTAEFYLSKDGYQSSNIPSVNESEEKKYDKLKYHWSSSDKDVAKYDALSYGHFLSDDQAEAYSVLERHSVFQIKNGTATISCTISDQNGNSITVSKQLTVLKGTPIKKLKVGKHNYGKSQRYASVGTIYSNTRKTVPLKISLAKNWRIDKITASHNTRSSCHEKNITGKQKISLKSKNNYILFVECSNSKTGQTFSYTGYIKRYRTQKIFTGNLQKGCKFIVNCRPGGMASNRTFEIQYKRKSKTTDRYTFKSAKDFVNKLKRYYGYTSKNIKLKHKKIYIKICFGDPYSWNFKK